MNATQGLVQFIGQKMGLSNLALDENLQATITLDDAVTITFLGEEGDVLTAVAYVADYEGDQEEIGRQLLKLNYLPPALGGGKLALNPKDAAIILTRVWDASIVDGEMLYKELEMFVNSVPAIRQEIENLGTGRATEKKGAEDISQSSPLMMYGRMA